MTTEAHSPQQPVLVIMGVSGSGKSTVAGILAGQLGWDLEEGDDLHPPANVEKMAAGTPLTDDDRWPWLNRVGSGPRPIWCSWRTGYTSPPRRCWPGSSLSTGLLLGTPLRHESPVLGPPVAYIGEHLL